MPLVTSKQLLEDASAGGYAIGAFNANNMECVQAVIEAADTEGAPVILQVSQGAIKYAGLEMATAMVTTIAELTRVPVVLHLDHGTDFSQNVRCLQAGFTSLMFDGSALPLDENIKITAKITEIAHDCDLPVEAELGKIPKIEDYFSQEEMDKFRAMPDEAKVVDLLRAQIGENVESLMADPADVEWFVTETGVDSLAGAVGSVHGMWSDIWPLRIDRLIEIRERTAIPVVCHGSSGVLRTRKDAEARGIQLRDGEGTVEDAIQNGMAKINVATAVSMTFLRGADEAWKKNPKERDLRKILLPGREACRDLVQEYIQLFGSSGKGLAAGASAGRIESGAVVGHE